MPQSRETSLEADNVEYINALAAAQVGLRIGYTSRYVYLSFHSNVYVFLCAYSFVEFCCCPVYFSVVGGPLRCRLVRHQPCRSFSFVRSQWLPFTLSASFTLFSLLPINCCLLSPAHTRTHTHSAPSRRSPRRCSVCWPRRGGSRPTSRYCVLYSCCRSVAVFLSVGGFLLACVSACIV